VPVVVGSRADIDFYDPHCWVIEPGREPLWIDQNLGANALPVT
jgi:hypothetical protein